jgi:uncharacterized DUF497 family protein
MKFEWDEAKRRANLEKHGLDFADLGEFDWTTHVVFVDDRWDYGEVRYTALALFLVEVHSVTFTRRGARVRIISFRRASRKELRRYGKEKVQT